MPRSDARALRSKGVRTLRDHDRPRLRYFVSGGLGREPDGLQSLSPRGSARPRYSKALPPRSVRLLPMCYLSTSQPSKSGRDGRIRTGAPLTQPRLGALIERVAERAPIMANRVLAVVRKMLNFAVDHDWIDANPAARVQKPTREVSRERVLTDHELRRVWRVLSHRRETPDKPAPGRRRAVGPTDDPLCPIRAEGRHAI